jgi:hypothetical protein
VSKFSPRCFLYHHATFDGNRCNGVEMYKGQTNTRTNKRHVPFFINVRNTNGAIWMKAGFISSFRTSSWFPVKVETLRPSDALYRDPSLSSEQNDEILYNGGDLVVVIA